MCNSFQFTSFRGLYYICHPSFAGRVTPPLDTGSYWISEPAPPTMEVSMWRRHEKLRSPCVTKEVAVSLGLALSLRTSARFSTPPPGAPGAV